MTNRLELNWKIDGFVDTQKYYCSETPINPLNLPTPKAVLSGDLRSYIDSDIDIGKTYYICIGSVKSGTEKIGEHKTISTTSNPLEKFVVFYAPLTENFNDSRGLIPEVQTPATIDNQDGAVGNGCLYTSQGGRISFDVGNIISGNTPFCFEMYLKAVSGNGAFFGLFAAERQDVAIATLTSNGALYVSKNGYSWWVNGANLPSLINKDWHHFAIDYNGAILKIFVDGIISESYDLPAGVTQQFTKIILGSSGGTIGYYYSCKIQHVRLTVGHSRYETDFLPPTVF